MTEPEVKKTTRQGRTSISGTPFVQFAALTTLKALVASRVTCAIPEEDLNQWLDEWDGDTKHRLALVTWHFDSRMHPPCTEELIQLVSAAHDDPQSVKKITTTIYKRSRYFPHEDNTHEETHEVFVSTLQNILEMCRKRIIDHPLVARMKTDQEREGVELGNLIRGLMQ
ncbi:uncharacterized protein BDZ99DRAFT_243049 [Mytilinidion resinicola]|uniref:Uncharacterized protein n=1 Tax=Mytilinidion resinicola TaxID=574789 RepID=A0A6A6YWM7_9PEZI|nr:uncharacterized protein BDZ99DRAFT_243049 [Mytilinidion resinicola]KAF2812803.1 hypothetical protein BDZ99DRAFT_243049 [Mytilinidion resinicola]